MDSMVLILGMAAMAQGLPYLVSPKLAREKMKRWLKHDDSTYRTYGAIACAFAVGILYLGLF